jgi:hypothetical protein
MCGDKYSVKNNVRNILQRRSRLEIEGLWWHVWLARAAILVSRTTKTMFLVTVSNSFLISATSPDTIYMR